MQYGDLVQVKSSMASKSIATPARNSSRLLEVWKGGLDLSAAEELLRKLPQNLQREAAVDLQRRLQPSITEWLQHWDSEDDI